MWQKRAVACQIEQFIHLELVCFSLEVFQAFNSLESLEKQSADAGRVKSNCAAGRLETK